MAVQSTAKKKTAAPKKKPAPKKSSAPKKKAAARPATKLRTAKPDKPTNTTSKPTAKKDDVSVGKSEEKPRDSFVNPLLNFDSDSEKVEPTTGTAETKETEQPKPKSESGADKTEEAKETKETEADQSEKKLPDGVKSEQAKQVTQQIQDFTNLATHLPAILKMGEEIKSGGIQAKHAEALKAAYGPMKGLLTPENIQAFKGMDLDQVDKLFSEQNMGILKAMSPKLAEGMNSEKIKQLKEGLQSAQGMLDPKKIGSQMMTLSPFVKTSQGEGVLNMVGRMVDDPNQLGGADRKLSMTDIGQVTNGLLNTGPVRGLVNGKIAGGINQAVNYRQNGQPRRPLGRAIVGGLTSRPKIRQKIYNKAWGQVRAMAPGEVRKQAAPYLGQGGSPQDRQIPRRFNDADVQHLMNVGQQLQSQRGQTASSGHQQIDNANSTMAGMTGILHKSLVGDDGAISGEELRNVSKFGTELYNYMGLLHHGVGGTFQR